MKQTPHEHPPEARGAAGNENAPHGVRADLKAYLDGELSGLSRWLAARHIARCAACRDEMRRLEHLGWQVQMLEQALPAPHLRARILASLPAAPPAPAPAAARFGPADARSLAALSRRPLGVAVGLCALFLMVGAFALARYGRAGGAVGNPAYTVARGGPDGSPPAGIAANAASHASVQEPATVSPLPSARTQPDPFAPSAIAQVGGSEGAVAPTDAARHSTPVSAGDTNSEAALPAAGAQAAYTDPTSAAADRIAATIIPDKLREKRQAAGAGQASANIPSSIPVVKTTAPAPMQMAVAVTDVSEASRQVRKWAEQAGAQVTVVSSRRVAVPQTVDATSEMAHSAYDAHSESGGASSDAAATPPVPQAAALLRLQVPRQQAAGLQAYLSHMAKSALSTARVKGEELNGVRDLKTEAVVTRPYPMSARIMDGEPAAPSKHNATVTILVRLQPESSAPRP